MITSLLEKKKTDGKLLEAKLRAGFPLKTYLERYYPDGKINGSGEYVGTCRICNKKDKFYYNMREYSGLCHSCYAKTDGAGFKTIIGLIMFTESLEYPQAIERLRTSSVTESPDLATLSEMSRFMNSLTAGEDEIDFNDIPIQSDIPAKQKPDLTAIVKYFNSRKRPMTVNILKLFPAYMSGARFLNGRIVFEVRTNDSYAWIGYLMGKATESSPKTLNPSGSVLSYMLHGYNYCKNKKEPLLVTEGIFDAYRCILRGYNAVASFGKTLSAKQIALINATKSTELVLCYDGDQAGMKAMWKVVKKWRRFINKSLSMIVLPYNTDPDDCDKKKFIEAFENRRRLT